MASERFRSLLMTGFNGEELNDPDDLIDLAFVDDRYLERVPPLIQLVQDPGAPPYERFVACLALTTWAEPFGYQSVTAAASDPAAAPWYEHSIDRRYAVDDTFAEFAARVRTSKDLSRAKNNEELRIMALRALLRIADREFFGWKLAFALDEETVVLVAADVIAAVERGVQRLADGQRPRFELAPQLADLAAALAPVDEDSAVQLGYSVAGVDGSRRTLTHLCAIPARGSGSLSQQFAEYLTTLGGTELSEAMDGALAQRRTANRV